VAARASGAARRLLSQITQNFGKLAIDPADPVKWGSVRESTDRSAEPGLWPNPESYRCNLITTLINSIENIDLMNADLGTQKNMTRVVVSDKHGISSGRASRLVNEGLGENEYGMREARVVAMDSIVPATSNNDAEFYS
jgi:hypothetical protein